MYLSSKKNSDLEKKEKCFLWCWCTKKNVFSIIVLLSTEEKICLKIWYLPLVFFHMLMFFQGWKIWICESSTCWCFSNDEKYESVKKKREIHFSEHCLLLPVVIFENWHSPLFLQDRSTCCFYPSYKNKKVSSEKKFQCHFPHWGEKWMNSAQKETHTHLAT